MNTMRTPVTLLQSTLPSPVNGTGSFAGLKTRRLPPSRRIENCPARSPLSGCGYPATNSPTWLAAFKSARRAKSFLAHDFPSSRTARRSDRQSSSRSCDANATIIGIIPQIVYRIGNQNTLSRRSVLCGRLIILAASMGAAAAFAGRWPNSCQTWQMQASRAARQSSSQPGSGRTPQNAERRVPATRTPDR